MKKLTKFVEGCYSILPKMNLKMKFTLLFFSIALFQLQAETGYAQKTKINLDLKEVSVLSVIDEIESKTEFRFLYSKAELNLERSVSILARKLRIERVLQKLFGEGKVNYKIVDRHIVLTPKKLIPIKRADLEESDDEDELQMTITGNVTDEGGAPLPGASIVEKGTTNGTQSDFDGNFSIAVTDENAILVISYIGFATKEIAVSGQTNINVALSETAAGLDEVVVVGYGTQKAKDLTGSIKQISAEDFKDNATGGNSTLALQGRVAGVRVVNTGSSPGAAPNITIRGAGSRNDDGNVPLFVIDGQIVSTGVGFLNPNDIETMTVLKDASAAAIYGSRAAAGVVLITTKRGKVGKPTIEFSSYYSFDRLTNEVDLLNAEEYELLNREWYTNADREPAEGLTPAIPGNTNWLDETLRTGSQQNYHLSIRGGGENNRYAVQAGYFHQEGLVKTTAFDRYSFRVNNDIDVGERFKLASSLDITYGQRARTNERDVIFFSLQYPKNQAVRDSEGNLVFAGPGYTLSHPLVLLENDGFDEGNLRGIGNVSGEYEILDGLKIKSTFGVEYSSSNLNNFSPTAFYPTDGNNINNRDNNRLEVNTNRLFVWNWDNQISYAKSFGDHSFDAILLHTAQESDFTHYGLAARNFLTNSPSLRVINASLSLDELAGSGDNGFNSKTQWAISSLVGRLNYNYKGKYLLTGTVRRDKSSRVHPDFREATFPSVSAGWVVSEESFFNVPFIDRLKFRGGWGEIGNEVAQDDYPYQSSFVPIDNYVLGLDQNQVPAVEANRIQNSSLQWEATTTTNFGMDLNMFNNRVSLTADYFKKDTEGIIIQPEFTALFGLQPSFQNTSHIRNSGFEIAFTYADNIGDFYFEISPNYSYIKNEIITLSPSEDLVDASVGLSRVGKPWTSELIYESIGVFQDQGEIDALNAAAPDGVYQEPGTAPGDVIYRDRNNDGEITPDDRFWFGQGVPPHNYGLSVTMKYKNFDLNVLGVGQAGGYTEWDPFFGYHNFIRPLEITGAFLLDRWHGPGTSNRLPRIVQGDPNQNRRASTLFFEDNDYFRIQNIQLGYTLPPETIESLGLSNLRLYAAGQNLFTFSDFNGFDPQTGYSGFPVAGSIYFGINATF
ncbi:TonB-dependent receptor [Flagellimonas onchidii]|uniref:TonB-dependent receptor n=1 Tax=Flagellimonas onchidii TaxID=2562684 RepID=UPI0010A60DB2|nr:TonB-dependent receptor [Allomuricauda onchidii]